ncbi:MAG: copper amine oxidase-like protein [Armatimonadetes bacterium]|nr:copper amine oxidase-like protein [Armatimonadota bacterium]
MNSPRTPAHALTLGFAALLATGLVGPAAAQIQVDVNGRPVSFGAVGPQRIGGRVLIPLRAVVEALGAEVTWDSATQTVLGRKGDREFSLAPRSAGMP